MVQKLEYELTMAAKNNTSFHEKEEAHVDFIQQLQCNFIHKSLNSLCVKLDWVKWL